MTIGVYLYRMGLCAFRRFQPFTATCYLKVVSNIIRFINVAYTYSSRSPVSVRGAKAKIHLKYQDSILSIPKFEDYTNDSNSITLQNLETKSTEYTFKWQEKLFSVWELQRYTDVHNCLTDAELNYHEMIESSDCIASKVFTYVHEDYHLPLPLDIKRNKVPEKVNTLNLSSCFQSLNLDGAGRVFGKDSSSMSHLFRSEENITMEEEQWTAMHVVFDHSEYNESSQLLLKQEATLISLYHNKKHNYLIVSPDVNDLDLNPYILDGVGYEYGVEIDFGGAEGEELSLLLKKLFKKWEKKQKQLISFVMPPLGKKLFYVNLEIVSASKFDMDNLYVDFHIKVPKKVHCTDLSSLHGRTHVSKVLRREDKEEWHFGHIVDLCFEIDASSEPPPLNLFFEVISTDWWGRHRTEGYTHLSLTLEPGEYDRHLSCSRPEELDSIVADIRRFFVGGCNLIKDLDVLAKPQLKEANFKFTTTGTLRIRYHTIAQSYLPVSGIEPAPLAVSSSRALLKGAEAALAKYKRARERLAAATGMRERLGDEGSGDG